MKGYEGSLEIQTGIFCDGNNECPAYTVIQHIGVDWAMQEIEKHNTVDEPFDRCGGDQPHLNRHKRMIAVDPIPCTSKVRRIWFRTT